MKKAKLMFVGLALFTTVGAALAFKAHKTSGNLFCTSIIETECPTDQKYITNPNSTLELYCSTVAEDCDLQTTKRKVSTNAR